MTDQPFDVRQLLHSLGYSNLKESASEFSTTPLYRNSDNITALCISKRTGVWIDFVTRQGGTFPELVKLTLNLTTIEEATSWLEGKNVHISSGRNEIPAKEITGPKIFDKALLVKLQPQHDYWTVKRKIKQDVLEEFRGGLVYKGKMAGRYVFPIFNGREQLIGFSGRYIYDRPDVVKWKHLGPTGEWVYPAQLNYEQLIQSKEIILVESIGDCLALFNAGIRNVLVIFGLNISSSIISFLIKIDIKCITISLNNDGGLTGRGNIASFKIQDKLYHYFDKDIVQISLPDKKDFGMMTPEEIISWNHKRHSQHQASKP